MKIYGLTIAIAALLLVVAYQFVEPAPPEKIIIATGQEGGAYHYFGLKYRKLVARKGIDLEIEIRKTSGTLENLRLLQDGESGVDLAFVQTGVGAPQAMSDLVSLGSLYYEPLWVFYRGEEEILRLAQLRGRSMAIGAEGSGTGAVALQLLEDNGLTGRETASLPLGGREAAVALQSGVVDVAFFVGGAEADIVTELLASEGVRLMSFARAEAYKSRYRYLSSVVLHQGTMDLERNIPQRDVVLLAPTATLVARQDFHPALNDLFLQIATEVHAEGGIFEHPGEFPSPSYLDFPLAREAQRYFEYGPPFLQRYLPFWVAVLLERLKVLLLPLITLLIPMFKVVPPAYRWRVRSKIYRWYQNLSSIEARLNQRGAVDPAELVRELERIEEEVARMDVPLSYQDEVYNLRLHIELVRDKVLGEAENRI